MLERKLAVRDGGPVSFFVEGDFATATVKVGGCNRAYAVLSTRDDEGDPGYEAIEFATLGFAGGWEHLKVRSPSGASSSSVIQMGRGGFHVSRSVNVTSGNMTDVFVTGDVGDVTVNGVRVTSEMLKSAERASGKRSGFSRGIELALHLPARSSLRTSGKRGSFLVTGEELDRVRFKSYSGDLDLRVPCTDLEANTYSGSVHAAMKVDRAEAEAYSGNVILSHLNGSGRLKSYSGNVTALCYAPGRVRAQTYSGNTQVEDRAGLGYELEVAAKTYSGRRYGRTR